MNPSAAAIAVVATIAASVMLILAPSDEVVASSSMISCHPADRIEFLGLDLLCSLLASNQQLSAFLDSTDSESPTVLLVLHNAVAVYLLCGECAVLGAVLFDHMVHCSHLERGDGLLTTGRPALASTLMTTGAVFYQCVCLGWFLGRLDLVHVVCLAPLTQTVLTAAVTLLYAVVMDVTPPSRSIRLSASVSLSQQPARFG